MIKAIFQSSIIIKGIKIVNSFPIFADSHLEIHYRALQWIESTGYILGETERLSFISNAYYISPDKEIEFKIIKS